MALPETGGSVDDRYGFEQAIAIVKAAIRNGDLVKISMLAIP
jgi:hypothetical protein